MVIYKSTHKHELIFMKKMIVPSNSWRFSSLLTEMVHNWFCNELHNEIIIQLTDNYFFVASKQGTVYKDVHIYLSEVHPIQFVRFESSIA